nr:DUF3841 domain-containing protein [Sedimentibacter sp.]
MDDPNKVKLWTRQDIKSLAELKENGVIRIKREHLEEKFEEISGYIMNLYSWFVNEAEKIVPKPDEVEFPIWCSISEESMLRQTEGHVIYVLEVDKSEIIYFDGFKWDYVLNHHYLPKDKKDEDDYEKDMQEKGFDNTFSFIDGKAAHFYPMEKKKVIDSWQRVFEIDNWDIFRIQANIWEIRPDMIKDVIS